MPHPMIVAGSRFRELYYWDSYWTLKGLLASGMRECALDMVRNFAHLISQHGFVPNGSRVLLSLQKLTLPQIRPCVCYTYRTCACVCNLDVHACP
jgi:glycogen debranching enzyme